MKYRSRSDIVGLLLDAANGGGATKTKLMYKAYLCLFTSYINGDIELGC